MHSSIKPAQTISRLITMMAVVFLVGCSHLSTYNETLTEQWAFNGKVAIRNASQASSFNVDWQQDGDRFNIKLTGPLGQGEVKLYGDAFGATLEQDGERMQARSLTQLVYETTQLDLPLEELMYWVRGNAYPYEQANISINEAGQTTQIQQTDWTVEISAYFDNQPTQPRKLNFQRGENSGKLIIRQWYRTNLPKNPA